MDDVGGAMREREAYGISKGNVRLVTRTRERGTDQSQNVFF